MQGDIAVLIDGSINNVTRIQYKYKLSQITFFPENLKKFEVSPVTLGNTGIFFIWPYAGMEYSYSYLKSYLLEYFFSVLSCTLYLAKFMSTSTRTYLCTVTKNPVLMSTQQVLQSTFLSFNQIGKGS